MTAQVIAEPSAQSAPSPGPKRGFMEPDPTGTALRRSSHLDSVVQTDPEILGGTPVFRGTRVPVKNLLDYLAAGDSLDQFLDDFPTVKREQAVAALELARDLLTAGAHPAR